MNKQEALKELNLKLSNALDRKIQYQSKGTRDYYCDGVIEGLKDAIKVLERCVEHQEEVARLHRLYVELTPEQAKNVELREAILTQAPFYNELEKPLIEAISAPSDTSALEALIHKAGEKMREKCLVVADEDAKRSLLWRVVREINALPCVTLEDLK